LIEHFGLSTSDCLGSAKVFYFRRLSIRSGPGTLMSQPQWFAENRMDTHKKARLTPRGRETWRLGAAWGFSQWLMLPASKDTLLRLVRRRARMPDQADCRSLGPQLETRVSGHSGRTAGRLPHGAAFAGGTPHLVRRQCRRDATVAQTCGGAPSRSQYNCRL
jgi:hypothetical protein